MIRPCILLALSISATLALAQSATVPVEKKPEPEHAPDLRMRVDSLSPADVKQAIELLRSTYLKPDALTGSELDRATLQGMLGRIAPGAQIVAPSSPEEAAPAPFRSEILDNRIGYIRLGSFTKPNLAELDTALKNFTSAPLKSVILDLRATPAGGEFDIAGDIARRFCAKGRILFSIKKTGVTQDRIFTADLDPLFQGLIVVLADRETAGAGELLAAVLRAHSKAMLIGQPTAGQAAEFSEMPLAGGKVLRVAVAEIVLPDGPAIFPAGLIPDIAMEMPVAQKRELLRLGLEKGVAAMVFDTERPRMNEAALVAGRNPEIDALQAAQQNKSASRSGIHDPVLQRAVDLITSIGIFEGRAQK